MMWSWEQADVLLQGPWAAQGGWPKQEQRDRHSRAARRRGQMDTAAAGQDGELQPVAVY